MIPEKTFDAHLQSAVLDAISNRVKDLANKLKMEAHREMNRSIDEWVAGIALEFSSCVRFETGGQEVIITVRKPEMKI